MKKKLMVAGAVLFIIGPVYGMNKTLLDNKGAIWIHGNPGLKQLHQYQSTNEKLPIIGVNQEDEGEAEQKIRDQQDKEDYPGWQEKIGRGLPLSKQLEAWFYRDRSVRYGKGSESNASKSVV